MRPTRQAASAVPDVLALMLAAVSSLDSPLGLRNRAILILGFSAAPWRSGHVTLRIGDVVCVSGLGLTVMVQRLKTDQHGRGQRVVIWANPADPLTCPLTAFERWLVVHKAAVNVSSCFRPRRAMQGRCSAA